MLSRWSIRSKLLLGFCLLLAIVVTLSWSGFDGLYAYRALLKNLRRINELPLATELGHRVSDLRVAADQTQDLDAFVAADEPGAPDGLLARESFRHQLSAVEETLDEYADQLQQANFEDSPLGDHQREQHTVERVRTLLTELDTITADDFVPPGSDQAAALQGRLRRLQALVAVSLAPEVL